MKNIDLFDEYAARILAEAYESFPVKKTIKTTKLCGHENTDEFGQVLDEKGSPSKYFEIAQATVEWLVDTGYLRGEQHSYGLLQAVLTAQGLAVLKATPESLQAKKSTGEALAQVVREGSIDAAKSIVTSALIAGSTMLAGR